MATTVTLNGSNYSIPTVGGDAWAGASGVDGYLVALATGVLTKAGGTFTLTADANFGATYGLTSLYFKSRNAGGTSVVSTTGNVRLANAESVSWRNQGNTADLALAVSSSNVLTFDGNPITALALGAAATVLRMNAGGTATEYAKITTANIDAAAAIVDTQLATIATAGKVSNSATTAASANTASAIVARDGSGNFTAGTITATLTGNVTGNLTGNVTGDVTGDVTGNVTGNLTGDVTGNVTGDVTGNVSGTSGSTTGNAATVTTNANLTGPVTSVGNATAIADGALALAKLATTTAGYIPVGAVTTGIPTYVAVSGDATLSSTGALTLGTVAIGKGGTGQTTANTALNALLPDQAAASGLVLGSNGADASWVAGLSTTLADGKIFAGNVSNVATAVTPSGEVTMTNAGVMTVRTATASVSGGVSTGTQTFAGIKNNASMPAFRATTTAAQGFTTGTSLIDGNNVFDDTATNCFDQGGNFTNGAGAGAGKFVVPTGADGIYLFSAQLSVTGAGVGAGETFSLIIQKNGVNAAIVTKGAGGAADPMGAAVTIVLSLVATDYVNVRVVTSDAGGWTVEGTAAYGNFCGAKLY